MSSKIRVQRRLLKKIEKKKSGYIKNPDEPYYMRERPRKYARITAGVPTWEEEGISREALFACYKAGTRDTWDGRDLTKYPPVHKKEAQLLTQAVMERTLYTPRPIGYFDTDEQTESTPVVYKAFEY